MRQLIFSAHGFFHRLKVAMCLPPEFPHAASTIRHGGATAC
jgi:hypothetical protein